MGKKYSNKESNIHRQIAPGVFIYMSSYSAATNTGYDFSIEEFVGDTLKSKLISSRIAWNKEKEKWVITNWKLRELDGDKEQYTVGKQLDTLLGFVPSEFSKDPSKIKEQLTLPELEEYIDRMKLRGSSNVVEFQIENIKCWPIHLPHSFSPLSESASLPVKSAGEWDFIWDWAFY